MTQKMPRNQTLHERRHKRKAGAHSGAKRPPMSTAEAIEDARIFPNRFRCRKCGDLCVSRFRHDFSACQCGNFVDGGNDYSRAGGAFEDMDFECDRREREER